MTLADAGPLIAIFDADDHGHARCVAVLPTLSLPLLTTWPCFAEAAFILRCELGYSAQEDLWQMRADGKLILHYSNDVEADRMRALMAQYRDIPMDLGDASLVAAAETRALRRVFTLDGHFYAYRTADGKPLEVVP